MTTIIVGIDDPQRSKDAVVLAAQLARATKAEIEAVCAYPYDDVVGRASNTTYRNYLREEAEGRIAKACAGIPDLPDVRPRTVADTSPARGIVERAIHTHASLIVVASSHRGAFGRVLAGTTAERLLHGAPCPVAVAPRGYAERPADAIATIGVAFDYSDEATAALTGALAMARALRARLRVISVLDTLWRGTPALVYGPGFYEDPETATAKAQERLQKLVEGLPADIEAAPFSLEGDPERRLVEETRSVDIMIAGSRGYGPHRAVLLGSVSGRLVRDASCPVIVLPRGIEEPFEALFAAPSDTQAV